MSLRPSSRYPKPALSAMKRPDPHTLIMAHVKATQNTKKWAMVAKGHMEAGRTDQARAALKKAEFWERKLKALER